MNKQGIPTEEGYYWARLYSDWNYDTRVWGNADNEWTIIRVEAVKKWDDSDTDEFLFYDIGDEIEHYDMGEICECVGPIPRPSDIGLMNQVLAWNENMRRKIGDGEVNG